MKTILAAIDFSPASSKVVTESVQLARLLGARVVLMHAINPPLFGAEFSGVVVGNLVELTRAMEQEDNEWLRRFSRRFKDVVSAVRTETGFPVRVILDAARRLKAAFIVLGSHGHGALYDFAVGSTAQGVLRRSRCPVLLVPIAPARRKTNRK